MIRFSIVTITYNAESVLGKTADSILAQTYPHLEHIIIDGASTDATLQVAQDYMQRSYAASNGHEIRIVSEPDNGLYDAMNKGLRLASGDYVLFLNAGDYFSNPQLLTNIVGNMGLDDVPKEKLPAVLYGNTDIVDNDGNFLRHRRLQHQERTSDAQGRRGRQHPHHR